jgi:prepilin-type N-terminal cleavage/methylation domain-containing protein
MADREYAKECRGFLLLELLVAVAVLGIVLVPLLGMFLGGAVNNAHSRMVTTAAHLAREKMEELRSLGYCRAESGFEEAVDQFPAYSRLVEVGNMEMDIKKITVTVFWSPPGGNVHVYRLDSYLGKR